MRVVLTPTSSRLVRVRPAAPECHLLLLDTAVKERRRTMDKLPGDYALIETTGALFGLAFSVAVIVAVFSVALAAFFHAFGF